MSSTEIPRQIDGQEILVRLLKTPIHYNPISKEVKKETFTPSSKEESQVVVSGKTFTIPGVSLMRLNYTNGDTCKQHGHAILNLKTNPPETFGGLFLFKSCHIEEVCNDEDVRKQENNKILSSATVVTVHGTPMDDSKPKPKYIPEGLPVYKDTPGNPMHADLIYNFPWPEKGKPNNPINKFARKLLGKGNHKTDTTSNPNVWGGDELVLD